MSKPHQKKDSRSENEDFIGNKSRGPSARGLRRSQMRVARPNSGSYTVDPLPTDTFGSFEAERAGDAEDADDDYPSPQPKRGRGRPKAQHDEGDGGINLSFFKGRSDQYTLPPTVPSPFTPNLQASLNALTAFGQARPALNDLVTALQGTHSNQPNWAELLQLHLPASRQALNELFLLVTRTLLPNQIAENRLECKAYYNTIPSGAAKLTLRWDTFFEWQKVRGNPVRIEHDGETVYFDGQWLRVAELHPEVSKPAVEGKGKGKEPQSEPESKQAYTVPTQPTPYTGIRPLLPNTISTLIFATQPPQGYTTKRETSTMAHHVTLLDEILFTTDEEVQGLADIEFMVRFTRAVQQVWMQLRFSNDKLREFAEGGYEAVGDEWALPVGRIMDMPPDETR